MDKRKLVIIIAGAVLVLAVAGILLFRKAGPALFNAGRGQTATVRENTLRLAESYLAAGDYQRALDLLDKLLIENPDDAAVRELHERVLRERLAAAEAGEMDRLLEALSKLSSDQNAAWQSAEEIARQAAAASAAAAAAAARSSGANASETEALLAAQREALERERLRLEAQAAERASAEAERKAAAEAEAARRRAEEEELARASRELQERMRAVNDLVSRGRAQLANNDLRGAQETFAEARSKIPPGETRFEAQRLAEMADAYYDFFARRPDSADGAEAAKEAAAFASEAAAKDPSQALPHYTMGKLSRDLRQTDKALAEFKEAARLEPANHMYSYELGRVSFTARRFTEAREAFETTVRLNSKFEPGWYNLGGSLRALNRQDEALKAYRQAIAVKADYALAHREVGRILAAKGDAKGAIESFNTALRYSPGDLAALRELGAAQTQSGDQLAAEASFARALQSAPADGQTNYNMAVVKLALNKNSEALNFARWAVEANGKSAVYAYTLGLAAEAAGGGGAIGGGAANGGDEAAIAAYRNAASLDPRYLRPRINLGSLYLSRGMPEDALRYLNEAYRLEPANFEVNNNMGAVYAKLENWVSSVDHYERALAAEANHPTVHLNLARAYAGAGDLARAQSAYQAVLRLAPENWDALFELGKTCVSLGRPDEAKKYLRDLLKRNTAYAGRADAERILAGL
jgi:tetratricopeptide (TPR) repeat protein